jgi:hypothetical protein
MTATTEVLKSITVESSVDLDKLAAAIEALSITDRNTTACAAAMAGGEGDMAVAVRADLDCIDICHAVRQVLTRATADASVLRGLLEAAVTACERSAAECGRHAHHHAHCRLCSEGTMATAAACRALLEDGH